MADPRAKIFCENFNFEFSQKILHRMNFRRKFVAEDSNG